MLEVGRILGMGCDVGDVVMMKAGGGNMVVHARGEGLISCSWKVHEGVKTAKFPPQSLVKLF